MMYIEHVRNELKKVRQHIKELEALESVQEKVWNYNFRQAFKEGKISTQTLVSLVKNL